jgi:glycosyltransferase involved in cell wall biosynthesis
MKKTILYAPNINKGGGLILLKSLIKDWPKDIHLFAYLDSRINGVIKIPDNASIKWINPSIYGRLKAEYLLSKSASSEDTILFKNSLPPIFKCKGRVIVFMQNRNFIENIRLRDFKLFDAIRVFLERSQSYLLRHRVDLYVVQTKSFKRKIHDWYPSLFLSKQPSVKVLPFIDHSLHNLEVDLTTNSKEKNWDFIYVADGLAQKNHSVLFDAWEELAKQNIFPSLLLTLGSSEKDLIERINKLRDKGVNIKNLGEVPHKEIINKYSECKALIYPSLRESFGMPLLEATALGIPILASELDYVYDVCKPVTSFNPESFLSVSRAVKRFLKIDNSINEINTAAEFIDSIILDKKKIFKNEQ